MASQGTKHAIKQFPNKGGKPSGFPEGSELREPVSVKPPGSAKAPGIQRRKVGTTERDMGEYHPNRE